MRQGLLPGQRRELERAFKKADAFDRFRVRTRRTFLGLGLASLGTAVGGFWLGRWSVGREAASADPIRARWNKKIPWAEAFAARPIEELVQGSATFLMTIDGTGGTPAMWRGFGRLAEWALATDTPQGRALTERLMQTARITPPPEDLAAVITRLARIRTR